jgi:hypothetical protein
VWPGGLVGSSLRRRRVVPGGPKCISTRLGRGPCDPYLPQKTSRHRSGRMSSRGRRRHDERSCPGCCLVRPRHLSRLRLQAADRSREADSMVVEGSGCRARTTVVLDVPCLCVCCVWKLGGEVEGRGRRSSRLSTFPQFVADHLHTSSSVTFTINKTLFPLAQSRSTHCSFLKTTQCRSLLPDAPPDQYIARCDAPSQPRRRLDPPSRNHHTSLAASRSLPPHNSPQGDPSLPHLL